MKRIGLVLGAGGSIGWAYHLGVIEGVRQSLGLELHGADRVIGTSAGGAIAASVLSGAGTDEVLDSIIEPISDEDRQRMQRAQADRSWTRFFRPQALSMVTSGGLAGLVGLLPAGVFPTVTLRRFPAVELGEWPANLWIPAVRLGDGEVVVFGRDRSDVEVIDAVEATSAVPALFQPKRFQDERFIDGAVASATHADLLVDDPPDLVILASPMTRPGRGPVRFRAARQLRNEVEALRTAGSEVVVLSPGDSVMEAANGYPRSRPEGGPEIVALARSQTEAALAGL